MNYKTNALASMFALILIGLVPLILVAMWTQRNLDFYLSLLEKHAVHVPYWVAFLVTLVTNAFIFSADVIGEIIRLFIH